MLKGQTQKKTRTLLSPDFWGELEGLGRGSGRVGDGVEDGLGKG